jgi:CheY-like chemotaxis protein
LCLVQRLVEQHRGTVEVFSTVGHGSEFVVRLPLIATRMVPSPPSVWSTRDEGHLARRVRILVVDDNVDAAESLGVLLRASGHAVWLAHDGEAALAVSVAQSPQVVLLDIGLPLLDGYEVAKQLRQQPGQAHVVIVAITGYGQARDRDLSAIAGFDHHLLKPLDLVSIENILAAVVP